MSYERAYASSGYPAYENPDCIRRTYTVYHRPQPWFDWQSVVADHSAVLLLLLLLPGAESYGRVADAAVGLHAVVSHVETNCVMYGGCRQTIALPYAYAGGDSDVQTCAMDVPPFVMYWLLYAPNYYYQYSLQLVLIMQVHPNG